MLKKLFFVLLMMNGALAAFSQASPPRRDGTPRLGILPFTGGTGGDGEAIADQFSIEPQIMGAFTVVPRTSVLNALRNEQNFQMSGYTDSDTIARLGRQFNADFVVSGHVRRLGNRNLIITTIINVETFELLVGDYRTYGAIEEVLDLLPEIAEKLIPASKRNTVALPKLAIAPFTVATQGAETQDGETLAQILAIEISNTEKFAVLPRTTTVQAALKELEYQMSGETAEDDAKSLGKATNAQYVLFASMTSVGTRKRFTAQVLDLENGSLLEAGRRDYQTVSDGIEKMKELALLLTDKAEAQSLIAARSREQARAVFFGDPARLWSVGVSAGSSFADPLLIATVRGTIAPLRYSFLEIGFDAGFISDVEGAKSYYSLYPFIHYAFFLPFPRKGGWYMGAGAGYMIAEYLVEDISLSRKIFAADVITGVNMVNFIDISYTLRTDFASANHKISVGYTYRFR